jgi:hypothetical protein
MSPVAPGCRVSQPKTGWICGPFTGAIANTGNFTPYLLRHASLSSPDVSPSWLKVSDGNDRIERPCDL